MEYAALVVLVLAPVTAGIAAYGTEIARLALFWPLAAIGLGFWIAYGWLNMGGLGVSRAAAAFVIGLYTLAWLLVCHLVIASGRALRLRRRRG